MKLKDYKMKLGRFELNRVKSQISFLIKGVGYGRKREICISRSQ